MLMLGFDSAMIASAGMTLVGIQVAESFGATMDQVQTIAFIASTVAILLLREEVKRFRQAIDDVADLKLRVTRLEADSGPHAAYIGEAQAQRERR